jgi:natural product biosynthesis luciferase-like monooxygenase protein/amino acid adenylation domain-containing protein
MKYKDLILLIYELINDGVKLYTQNEKIKFVFPDNYILSNDKKSLFQKNKLDILKILKKNNITTPNYEIVILPKSDNNISLNQERVWFIEKYENGSQAYIIPIILKLTNQLNLDKFINAINAVIRKHRILHSSIASDGQLLYQNSKSFKNVVIECSIKKDMEDSIQEHVNRKFDLEKELPFRIQIYKFKNNYYCSIAIHHIVFDGWSTDIFLQELKDYYFDNFNENRKIQYEDFSFWQKEWLNENRMQKLLNFWKNELQDYEKLNLRTTFNRPAKFDYSSQDYILKITSELSDSVKSFSKHNQITLNTVLTAVYFLTLQCYSGQNNITIGTVLSGRNYPQTQDIIGFFINILPLKIKITENLSFIDFAKEIAIKILEIQKYQDIPFNKIVEGLKIPQDFSSHPIFQTIFVVQTFANKWNDMKKNGIGELYKTERTLYTAARFDLTVFIDDSNSEITGVVSFATKIFDLKTIEGFFETYKLILSQVLKNPLIQNIKYVEQVPNPPYIQIRLNILKQIETNATKNPSDIAVIFNSKELTYGELWQQVNNLAIKIKSKSTFVAVMIDRSEEMIIAILAVLKSGHAYLPIDPTLPQDRIDYMIQDSGVDLIITSLSQNLSVSENCHQTNLMYLIYTSGSTGRPKGVQISFSNVANILYDMQRRLHISQNSKWLAVTTISFDISVLEIFLPLISGATIVLASKEDAMIADNLIDLIKKYNCDLVQATPSTWKMLKISAWHGAKNMKILCGGETLPQKLAEYLREKVAEVWNVYGPTETTIWSTVLKVKNESITLGKPILNTEVFILDKQNRILPQNAIGEIGIAGHGVSLGYWQRPELNEEKFITILNKKVYKTGDLGSILLNNEIEFYGRNDFQVKVRGYRIETQEIENQLLLLNSVEKAVVISHEVEGETKLVAHIVPTKHIPNNLKFSLFYFSAAENYDLYFESVKFADQNAFEAVWSPERHFHKVGGNYPNPSLLAAATAMVTSNVKIRAGSVVLPLHNPIRIAEEWAIVDNLSNGRIGIAFAAGWNLKDFAFFPEKYHNRKDILWSDLKKVWSFWLGNDKEITTFPRPIQKKLPTWITTSFAKENFIKAGQEGVNILTHLLGQDIDDLAEKIALYRKSLKESRHSDGIVTLMLHTFIANSTTEAINISKKPFCEYLKEHISLVNTSTFGTESKEEDLDRIIEIAFNKYSRESLIGSVEDCLKNIEKFKKIGIDEFACFIDFGIQKDLVIQHLPNLLKLKNEYLSNFDSKSAEQEIAKAMPNYMLPNAYLVHNDFQYNNNGKINRFWLIEETKRFFETKQELISVSASSEITENERLMCEIWKELLKISHISPEDDFFKLGGHSLLAIQLLNKINKTFNIEIPLGKIFELRTLKRITSFIEEHNPVVSQEFVLEAEIYPLSFAQEKMWFAYNYDPDNLAYNTYLVFKISSNIEDQVIKDAIQYIIDKHEILKTTISLNNNDPILNVLENYKFETTKLLCIDKENMLNSMQKDSNHIFDLSNEIPILCKLYILDQQKYLGILVHHIAFDGWSTNVIYEEIVNYFNNNYNPSMKMQYKHYALLDKNTDYTDHLNFWTDKLKSYNNINLTICKTRPKFFDSAGKNIDFVIDHEITLKIKNLAKELNTTVFNILLAVYYLTLLKFNDQSDVCIGVLFANRENVKFQNNIGLFVNALPIRIRKKGTFEEIIQHINKEIYTAYQYQNFPIEKLVKNFNLKKETSKNHFFQTVFNFGNIDSYSDKITYCNEINLQTAARFDITFTIREKSKGLSGYVNYATALFEQDDVVLLVNEYKNQLMYNITPINKKYDIIKACLEVLNIPIQDISLEHDFFQIGGDSMSATKLVNKIKNETGIKIKVKEIFKSSNLLEISNLINYEQN